MVYTGKLFTLASPLKHNLQTVSRGDYWDSETAIEIRHIVCDICYLNWIVAKDMETGREEVLVEGGHAECDSIMAELTQSVPLGYGECSGRRD